jgi:hypothetical protein
VSQPPTGPPYRPPMPGRPWPGGYGPPPPKKPNTTLIVLLSVLGAFVVMCGGCGVLVIAAGSSGGDAPRIAASDDAAPHETAGPGGTPRASRPPEVSGVGKPVRDGEFEFTVSRVRCGVKLIGSTDHGSRPQGQFCLVTMTVKNIGNGPQTLSDSDQKAFVGDAEYATDSSAGWDTNYGNDNDSVWLNEINPGNKVTGTMVWDIPVGAKLTKLELHDSGFSDGVEVAL